MLPADPVVNGLNDQLGHQRVTLDVGVQAAFGIVGVQMAVVSQHVALLLIDQSYAKILGKGAQNGIGAIQLAVVCAGVVGLDQCHNIDVGAVVGVQNIVERESIGSLPAAIGLAGGDHGVLIGADIAGVSRLGLYLGKPGRYDLAFGLGTLVLQLLIEIAGGIVLHDRGKVVTGIVDAGGRAVDIVDAVIENDQIGIYTVIVGKLIGALQQIVVVRSLGFAVDTVLTK